MGNWRARLHGASLLRRYMTEAEFRTEASLYLPLGLNLLYALYKGAAGLYYRSAWFGSMALYYILLSAERFYLLHHVRDGRRDMGRQLRCYRFCGCLLLVSTAAILAMGFHQTAMFTAFGDGAPWQAPMNLATGIGVLLLISGMALFMIVHGGRSIAAVSPRQ